MKTFTTTRIQRFALTIIGALFVLTACGAADATTAVEGVAESAAVDADTQEVSAPEDVDESEAPTTLAPTTTTQAPTTTAAPTTTETPTTTAPKPVEASPDAEAAFCEASADYWTAVTAGDSIDLENPIELEAVFTLISDRLDTAIVAAPDDELVQPALAARRHLDVIIANVAAHDYDLVGLVEDAEYQNVEAELDALGEIDDLLESYLEGPCGMSIELLTASAEGIATEIALTATEQVEYPGYIDVVDLSDRLKVTVPEHWTDMVSTSIGATSEMTLAPDVDEFEDSWAADGMHIRVTDASAPIDWRAPMAETAAADQCVPVSSVPYDDGLYTGWIDTYEDCGIGSTAVVIGAVDDEMTVEILVEVQFDIFDTENDAETLDTIIETFKAR